MSIENGPARLPLSRELVERNTAGYPEPARDAVGWLWDYGKRNGLSMGELAAELGRDTSLVSRLLGGKYEVRDWQPLTEDILRLRDRVELDQRIAAAEFVLTSNAQVIWEAAEWAREDRGIVLLWGNSQTGKSASLQQFDRDHPDTTRFVEIPSGGSLKSLMAEISLACRIGTHSNFSDWRRRLFNAIKPGTLLILDEFDVLFTTPFRQGIKVAALEFIREIWNRCQCGVLLVGTEEARGKMEEQANHAVLHKLRRRALGEVWLEPFAPAADLDALAAHYGLPAAGGKAREVVHQMVRRFGLKKYISHLKKAAALARQAKRRVTWTDFLHAHDAVAALAVQKGGAR